MLANILLSLALSFSINTASAEVTQNYIDMYRFDTQPQYVVMPSVEELESRPADCLTIEIVSSVSNGDGTGTTANGGMIAYNKDTPKGVNVVSYVVYNPATPFSDDVLAVIDNGCMR